MKGDLIRAGMVADVLGDRFNSRRDHGEDVVVATLDQSFKEIARTLYEKDISGLPVFDEKGCVVGIVTEADLRRAEDSEGEVARRHSFLDAVSGAVMRCRKRTSWRRI